MGVFKVSSYIAYVNNMIFQGLKDVQVACVGEA